MTKTKKRLQAASLGDLQALVEEKKAAAAAADGPKIRLVPIYRKGMATTWRKPIARERGFLIKANNATSKNSEKSKVSGARDGNKHGNRRDNS